MVDLTLAGLLANPEILERAKKRAPTGLLSNPGGIEHRGLPNLLGARVQGTPPDAQALLQVINFLREDPGQFIRGYNPPASMSAGVADIADLFGGVGNRLGGGAQTLGALQQNPDISNLPPARDPGLLAPDVREAFGIDPDSPQAFAGEITSPIGTAFKVPALLAKIVGTTGLLAGLTKFATPLAALVIPKAQATARLGRKIKRESKPDVGVQVNEVQVLRAEGKPDFVVGRLSTNDWVTRTESLLSPEEIANARNWYKEVRNAFVPAFGEEDADLIMTAYLMANKNASPEQALGNALRVAEQVRTGTTGLKGGLNDAALRKLFAGETIEKGVGQKLFDFIDSATGRSTRRFYGDATEAGAPAVIDVHSARDMGYVDQALINHLNREGYDTSNLKRDFTVDKKGMSKAPSETQYERAGDQMRELTNQLNEAGFAGGNLTPAEVQAIGWTAMSRFIGAKGDDTAAAISGNVRRVAFELAPGRGSPNAAQFGERFDALGLEDQITVTNQTLDDAVKFVEDAVGVQASSLVHGTGGWQRFDPNPAQVSQMLASSEGAEVAANMIGYLAQQEEVWITKLKLPTKTPKGFGIVLHGDNLADDGVVRSLWGTLLDKDTTGLIQGYQPVTTIDGKPGIMMLVDRGGKKTAETIDNEVKSIITEVIESGPADDIIMDVGEAEITKAGTNGGYDGETYLQRIRELGRGDLIEGLDSHRLELEKRFGENLAKVEGKKAGTAGAE